LTREDTIRIFGIITAAYPNFDRFRDEKHIKMSVNVWADMFADDDPALVAMAVKSHISTSKWPPSIAEIREIMVRISRPDILPVDEAWAIAVKYLQIAGEFCHRDYHAELPKAIAEAIDAVGYGQLYALHVAHARGNESKAGLDRVTFAQAYENKIGRERDQAMLPKSLRQTIQITEAATDDGTAALIENINREHEEVMNRWSGSAYQALPTAEEFTERLAAMTKRLFRGDGDE